MVEKPEDLGLKVEQEVIGEDEIQEDQTQLT
jgi:hypothetical protein